MEYYKRSIKLLKIMVGFVIFCAVYAMFIQPYLNSVSQEEQQQAQEIRQIQTQQAQMQQTQEIQQIQIQEQIPIDTQQIQGNINYPQQFNHNSNNSGYTQMPYEQQSNVAPVQTPQINPSANVGSNPVYNNIQPNVNTIEGQSSKENLQSNNQAEQKISEENINKNTEAQPPKENATAEQQQIENIPQGQMNPIQN